MDNPGSFIFKNNRLFVVDSTRKLRPIATEDVKLTNNNPVWSGRLTAPRLISNQTQFEPNNLITRTYADNNLTSANLLSSNDISVQPPAMFLTPQARATASGGNAEINTCTPAPEISIYDNFNTNFNTRAIAAQNILHATTSTTPGGSYQHISITYGNYLYMIYRFNTPVNLPTIQLTNHLSTNFAYVKFNIEIMEPEMYFTFFSTNAVSVDNLDIAVNDTGAYVTLITLTNSAVNAVRDNTASVIYNFATTEPMLHLFSFIDDNLQNYARLSNVNPTNTSTIYNPMLTLVRNRLYLSTIFRNSNPLIYNLNDIPTTITWNPNNIPSIASPPRYTMLITLDTNLNISKLFGCNDGATSYNYSWDNRVTWLVESTLLLATNSPITLFQNNTTQIINSTNNSNVHSYFILLENDNISHTYVHGNIINISLPVLNSRSIKYMLRFNGTHRLRIDNQPDILITNPNDTSFLALIDLSTPTTLTTTPFNDSVSFTPLIRSPHALMNGWCFSLATSATGNTIPSPSGPLILSPNTGYLFIFNDTMTLTYIRQLDITSGLPTAAVMNIGLTKIPPYGRYLAKATYLPGTFTGKNFYGINPPTFDGTTRRTESIFATIPTNGLNSYYVQLFDCVEPHPIIIPPSNTGTKQIINSSDVHLNIRLPGTENITQVLEPLGVSQIFLRTDNLVFASYPQLLE